MSTRSARVSNSDVKAGDMSGTTTAEAENADESELARMGSKQELKRDLGLMQNFGVSFSIISILTGIPSLFLFGLNTGGPAVITWGWIVASCFTMFIGLAMAEVCSSHPTSGGPYFWAAMLSKPEHAPFASWITGWFNLLGQVAVTTGISFACANFISTVATLNTDFAPTTRTTLGVYAAVLVAQGLINTFGVNILKHLNNISIWWHGAGTLAIVIAILAAAPSHQSARFVFQKFVDNTGVSGDGWSQIASPAYVVVIGMLTSQYSLIGFDASAHMTEETRNAATSASLGIIMAIGVSAVLGWFFILGLLFSIQDLDATIASDTGQPVAQIFLDTVGTKGAIVLMVIVIGAMFFCGTFSVTSNSRMMYAFARDGGYPGHRFFAQESQIFLRVLYRSSFTRGPFHLGRFSYPVAIIAVLWILFISIAFILPQEYPVNSQTLNYAIVAVGIIVTYSLGFWLISARKWFKGPVRQIRAEGKGVDVMNPVDVEKAAQVKVENVEEA
ncbi:APC amino acid permease [Panus rudis PR-1116 ss-1]|nr:APC amino acid permease [Panus rudis PR-1116 ss-1]